MTAAPDLKSPGGNRPSSHAGRAALDLMLVLGTLFAIKEALLGFDILWTYAGPISLVASVLVAGWRLRKNGESWAGLGLKRPASIPRTLMWSLVAMIVTIAAGIAIEFALSSANIGAGTSIDPRYSRRFAGLPGNAELFAHWLLVSWIVGGFAEEMLFRAMLFSRLERLFSWLPYPALIAVVLQAVLFGQQHYYYQGLSGALATGGIGLVSGALYVALKRALWPLVLSHGLANTLGLTLIYTGMQPPG